MSKGIILVVEDNEDAQVQAREVIEAAGYEVDLQVCLVDITPAMVKRAVGVITDLYFPPFKWAVCDSLPPCGLMVAIDAISVGKPVVICTSGDHHGPELSWIHDAWLAGAGYRFVGEITYARKYGEATDAPFGWNDHKDYSAALEELEKRMG